MIDNDKEYQVKEKIFKEETSQIVKDVLGPNLKKGSIFVLGLF